MTAGQRLAAIATLVMIAAVGGGLWVNGTPAHQRALSLDLTRQRNLMQIEYAVRVYGQSHRHLPDTIEDLPYCGGCTFKDPVSGTSYGYSKQDDSYRLCASFDEPGVDAPGSADPFASHPKGYFCFERKLTVKGDATAMPSRLPGSRY